MKLNRKEKLLAFYVAAALIVFALFMAAINSIPLMLVIILVVAVGAGLLYKYIPGFFDFLKKPPKRDETKPFTSMSAPLSHMDEKRTYLMLVGVNASGAETIVMDQTPFTVGRGKRCSYRCQDPMVSTSHLRLEYNEHDKQCYVTDMNSTNGTFVNGEKLMPNQQHELRAGDLLQIAFTAYTVEYVHF